MTSDDSVGETISEARTRLVRQLADLQRQHVGLAGQAAAIKKFGNNGAGQAEIRLAYEMLEQYLSQSDAFLENMRGRFEARLGVLRRSEPMLDGKPNNPDLAPGHTEFWLEFSRLTSVLRRITKRMDH
jgi:hypothetical protein